MIFNIFSIILLSMHCISFMYAMEEKGKQETSAVQPQKAYNDRDSFVEKAYNHFCSAYKQIKSITEEELTLEEVSSLRYLEEYLNHLYKGLFNTKINSSLSQQSQLYLYTQHNAIVKVLCSIVSELNELPTFNQQQSLEDSLISLIGEGAIINRQKQLNCNTRLEDDYKYIEQMKWLKVCSNSKKHSIDPTSSRYQEIAKIHTILLKRSNEGLNIVKTINANLKISGKQSQINATNDNPLKETIKLLTESNKHTLSSPCIVLQSIVPLLTTLSGLGLCVQKLLPDEQASIFNEYNSLLKCIGCINLLYYNLKKSIPGICMTIMAVQHIQEDTWCFPNQKSLMIASVITTNYLNKAHEFL